MNLGKRFGVALQMAGINPPAVSRSTGIPVASINALIRRDSSRSNYVEQLLGALPASRVNIDWVRTGQGTADPINTGTPQPADKEQQPTQAPPSPQLARAVLSNNMTPLETPLRSWEHEKTLPPGAYVFLPRLLATHDADTGAVKIVFLIEEMQVFRADWIRDDHLPPAGLCWVTAPDDSMEPVLWQGDACVVNTREKDVQDGKVYALMYAGRPRLRRLFLLPGGGLRLKPTNDKYESFDVHDPSQAVIIGRVVRKAGKGGL